MENLLDGDQIDNAECRKIRLEEEVYPASVETVGTLYVVARQ